MAPKVCRFKHYLVFKNTQEINPNMENSLTKQLEKGENTGRTDE